ncbi:MAG: hypothetical protein ACYCX9_02800 [Candidatus Dormibacteria bacterium]
MNEVVVVGDAELQRRTHQLLPNFQVIGIAEDPDFGDPITSVAPLRSLIESSDPPDAVVCSASPGFTALSQLAHFPPNRCFIHPSSPVGWPMETMRWMAEATGMALLPNLEALPAAILARGLQPAPKPQEGPAALPAKRNQQPTPPGEDESDPRDRDFAWADATPVQVPPPPVSLDPEPVPRAPQVIDAGPQSPRSAYLPTDLLRPLRPRTG